MKILIKNGTVVTLGQKNRVLKNHSLLIEDDKIAKIAPTNSMDNIEVDKTIIAHGKVIMPGFINTHMHYYSSMARGLYKVAPSYNFQEVLDNLWWKLDRKLSLEDSYYSAMIANISAIKHGTTTIIDHHASPFAIRGSLAKIASSVKECGLRANLCYELSDRDGEKIALEGIEENAAFIRQCQTDNDPQLRAMFGMHASFTIGQETLKKATKVIHQLGAGVHIHCAEDLSDQIRTVKEHGTRVVERLFKAELLGEKTILAHGIHLNEHELHLIMESRSNVVINPQSNMNNAVGVTNLIKMSELDINVGLGTDAMTLNMLEELRSALWINKLTQKNPSIGFMETTNALIHGNRNIANIFWKEFGLGELKAGAAADIVLMDYHSPTPFTEDSFLGHLIFGLSQEWVDTTIASGKVLMENKKLTMIDEEQVMAKAQEACARLWDKF